MAINKVSLFFIIFAVGAMQLDVLRYLSPVTTGYTIFVAPVSLLLLGIIAQRFSTNLKLSIALCILVWSLFSLCFIGIGTPLALTLSSGFSDTYYSYLIFGIVFLVLAIVSFYSSTYMITKKN